MEFLSKFGTVIAPHWITADAGFAAFTQFMIEAHDKGVQPTRKYTGEPYATHPIAVADSLHTRGVRERDILIAALGHDIIEDTPLSAEDIFQSLPAKDHGAVTIIEQCSEDKVEGNRKFRHAAFNEKLAAGSRSAHIVKFADTFHNLSTLPRLDKDGKRDGYAIMYAGEKDSFVARIDKIILDFPTEHLEIIYRSLRLAIMEEVDSIVGDSV